MSTAQTVNQETEMPFWRKLIFGMGDWSTASFGTLRQLFYAIFLTDVVGLEPRLASFVALIGIVWDAINDPMVHSPTGCVRAGDAGARSCCSSPFHTA